jgi:SAM-dependent methyltransferase
MRNFVSMTSTGIQGVLKIFGGRLIKKILWDREFKIGRWDYIDHTRNDVIYDFLERYSKGGSILDLGCGSGNTGCEMDVNTYNDYTGVDISKEAIRKAIERSARNYRNRKNRYIVTDIWKYVAEKRFDLILFRESIHYTREGKIKILLDKYSSSLKENGVFIVRMCDSDKYEYIVRIIEENFNIVEKNLVRDSKAVMIAFKPMRQ